MPSRTAFANGVDARGRQPVPPPRHRLGRGRRGRGHRHRPHRARRRRRGLPAGQEPRAAGHRAARRGRPLPRRASGRSPASTRRASRREIIEALQARGFFYHLEPYTHRYPHCWRCGTALLFRVVDEWYISMGPVYDVPRAQVTPEQKAASLRYQIMDVVDQHPLDPGLRLRARARLAAHDVRLDRSRRSATGAWRCPSGSARTARRSRSSAGARSCGERARRGFEALEGRTPHRPWVDGCPSPAGPAAARCARIRGRRQPLARRRHRALQHAPLPRATRTTGRSGSRPTSSPSRSRASSATGSTRCSR